jgi:Domain of unknown function (DUF5658)
MTRSLILFAALQILNVFDAVMTLWHLMWGTARELNPLMRAALNTGPWCFLILKLALVCALSALLVKLNARRTLMALVFVYAVLACYHVAGAL